MVKKDVDSENISEIVGNEHENLFHMKLSQTSFETPPTNHFLSIAHIRTFGLGLDNVDAFAKYVMM